MDWEIRELYFHPKFFHLLCCHRFALRNKTNISSSSLTHVWYWSEINIKQGVFCLTIDNAVNTLSILLFLTISKLKLDLIKTKKEYSMCGELVSGIKQCGMQISMENAYNQTQTKEKYAYPKWSHKVSHVFLVIVKSSSREAL